jgi:hypothetical protein
MAFHSFFQSIESTFSLFLDQVISQKEEWSTKEDLLTLFHSVQTSQSGQSNHSVQSGDVKYTPIVSMSKPKSDTMQQKQSNANEPLTEKCMFIITRGDKMGDKCGSRTKQGTSYCVKHYKPPKEDGTPLVQDEKKEEVKKDTKTFSLEMKFKKVDEEPIAAKSLEIIVQDEHRLVKSTQVVVNSSDEIIGYLQNKQLVYGSTKEVDKVAKEYKLVINKSNWKEDHIDE